MTGSKSRSETAPASERRRLGRVRAAGLAAGLAALLALLPWALGARLDERVFDQLQRLHPRDLTGMRVAVVAIDSDSLRAIGSWPWSRDALARLTNRIGAAGPRAIGYDMFFPDVDRQSPSLFADRYAELSPPTRAAILALPSYDEAFGRELGHLPTVLARAGVRDEAVKVDEHAYADAGRLPVEAVFARPLPKGVTDWPQAIASIPAIEEQSAGHGLVNGEPDADGVVRRVPAVGLLAGTANTGFAVEIARVAARLDGVTPRVAGGVLTGVALGSRTIPVAPDGHYRLHFGRVPDGSVISAVELFRRGFHRELIAGKAVVVGLTGAGTTDVVTTPLDARYPGPVVQAQAVDAIERGGWLDRPRCGPAAELTAGLALVLAVVLLAGRVGGAVTGGLAIATTALALAVAWAGFVGAGLLIDPLVPLLIGAGAATGAFVALFLENAIVQRGLRAALVEQRLSAARAAGELEAARKIQQGMLTLGSDLARLDARIDLDARLEPARAIGGDFYDAYALPDGRLLFAVGDVTGKGVPAALFMALAKALARGAVERHPGDLGAAVAALSSELSRDNAEDMFVTLLIGVVDPADGTLVMVNAGHENPLVRRAGGTVEELALRGGPPVCAADDFPYAAEAFALAPGDGLIVVTDGVTEAQDAAGGFLDRAGAVAALNDLPPDWRAEQATAALTRAVRAFENGIEPTDDLTVLALRRTPVNGR